MTAAGSPPVLAAHPSPLRAFRARSARPVGRLHVRVPRLPSVRRAGAAGALFLLAVWGGIAGLDGRAALAAEGPVIEKIEVRGNHRLTTDAFLFASGLKVGDPYDPAEIRKAYRRLWDKELFTNLKVEAEDGATGKIVIFTVEERAILVSVDYDPVRSITKSNIEDIFHQRGLELGVGKPFNQKVVWKAEEYIRDLLGSKGYLDAQVKGEAKAISTSSIALAFHIRQGPRTKIKKITFVGNQVYSSHKLKGVLEHTREHSMITSIQGKDLWRPGLYDQDVQKVFELYRAAGYLDVEIKPPVVEIIDPDREKREAKEKERAEKAAADAKKEAEKQAKKKRPPSPGKTEAPPKEPNIRRWVYLTVKVKEGPQYKTGEIKVKGNSVFTDKEVLQRVYLRPGFILNDSALQASLDRLRADYGNRGYIYATATKSVVRREGNIADVTIEIDEDKPYTIDRIEFEGNSVTRDSVLRREMRVNEGDLLNRGRLDVSGYKIQQLGFVRPDSDPFIEPLENTDLARVRIKLEEQGKNEIQVGGGYSGLDGFFFTGSYSTRNFLGKGEILSAAIQTGGATNRYQVSFREPWFMGKPYSLGFSLFRRESTFAENQTRKGAGGTMLLGRQLGDFSSGQLLYSFEKVGFIDNSLSVSAIQGQGTETNTKIGSLTPSLNYDRVNNPFRPTSGQSLFVSSQIAGSVFFGTNNFWKPQAQGTKYFRGFFGRTFIAIHGEAGFIVPYGKGAVDESQIQDIPRSERFYIGGDLIGPRIFETRTIGPVQYVSRVGGKIAQDKDDIVRFKRGVLGEKFQVFCDLDFDFSPEDGLCNLLSLERIGGNRFFLTQFEYAVPLAQPLIVAAFLDVGNAYAENEGLSFDTVRVSTGIEARIFLPVFQAPIRFIFGRALRSQPIDSTNAFQFSIGTSF